MTPNQCSGAFGCTPGSCPTGQVCYHDDDPFDDRSFCVSDTTCGPLSPAELAAWERESVARQDEVRREREAKEARRAAWQAEHGTGPAPEAAEVDRPQAVPKAPRPTSQPAIAPTATARPRAERPPLPCEETPERAAARIRRPGQGDAPVTLSAGETFEQPLPEGWRFVLRPATHGWHVQILDRPEARGAIDLSAVTPPLRGDTNPRFVFGWHFRNRDNTAANTGEVNAPQRLRLFEFEPELTGTGGYRPPDGAAAGGAPGRGWLRIEELTLSPQTTGERAHIERMTFDACLTWPRPDAADRARWQEALRSSRDALAANAGTSDLELVRTCGLSPDAYALDALVQPPTLRLDIDGDGRPDRALQARRLADDARGIALCRAGAAATWIGRGHPVTRDPDLAHGIAAMEAWRVVPKEHGTFGYVGEPPWPEMAGDALVVERLEKSMAVLYWRDGAVRAHQVYRVVEP